MKHLHGVAYDTKWIMFQGLLNVASDPSEWGGSNTKLGVVTSNDIVVNFWKLYSRGGVLKYLLFLLIVHENVLQSLNLVHLHFTLSSSSSSSSSFLVNLTNYPIQSSPKNNFCHI